MREQGWSRRVALTAIAVAIMPLAMACSGADGPSTPDLAAKIDQASSDTTPAGDAGRDASVAADVASPDLMLADQGRDLGAARDQGALDTIDAAIVADLGAADQLADVTPTMVPSFSLTDVNPSSASYNTKVSPRDYLGKVAAFFFTTAT